MYNILNCAGFCETTGWVSCSPCLKAKLGLVLLFFIIAVIRKWGSEEVGLDFNFLLGLVGGLVPYFIVVVIFGSFKMAMIIGLVGALILGYGGGMLFGGSDDSGGYG